MVPSITGVQSPLNCVVSKNIKIEIYKNIIFPVVLYGCETWSLTLREKHRLRVFENRVLRRIFGPKRDKVTGDWTELHNEALHSFYSSSSIIRMIKSRTMRWAGHVARIHLLLTFFVLSLYMLLWTYLRVSISEQTFQMHIPYSPLRARVCS
jgi:hypothetical protein